MARGLDRLLNDVRQKAHIYGMSPIELQVILNRIETPPSREEIQRATDQVHRRAQDQRATAAKVKKEIAEEAKKAEPNRPSRHKVRA